MCALALALLPSIYQTLSVVVCKWMFRPIPQCDSTIFINRSGLRALTTRAGTLSCGPLCGQSPPERGRNRLQRSGRRYSRTISCVPGGTGTAMCTRFASITGSSSPLAWATNQGT